MKPLPVLLLTFVISLIALKMITGNYDHPFAAIIAMSAMLLFTSTAHFIFTKGMAMMIPGTLPFKAALVYFTGVIEIAAAIALMIPACRLMTAWMLIVFFILLFPANINAAIRHIDYQKGTYNGPGPNYLWFRIPLQILFIMWIYFAAIR